MVLRKTGFALILCFVAIGSRSQPSRQYNGQRFKYYAAGPGSLQLHIDRQGYLWIGTDNGIRRFNGYGSDYFQDDPMDSAGFTGAQVYAITEDQEGGLWVGTNLGVNYRDPRTGVFRNIYSSNDPVYSIVEGDGGLIWWTQGDKIVRLDQGSQSMKPLVIPLGDSTIFIRKLIVTGDRKMLGTGTGCYELDFKDPSNPYLYPIIKETHISDIAQRKDGSLVLTSDSDLYTMDSRLKNRVRTDLGVRSSGCVLHIDMSGTLWLGLDQGILMATLDEDLNFLDTVLYNTGKVNDIVEDPSGNLFFGVEGNGILKLGWDHTQYDLIPLPPGFEDAMAIKFLEDEDGDYWLGTTKGLLHYSKDQATYRIYSAVPENPAALPHPVIYSLFEDRDGTIWAGTGNGVVTYEEQRDGFTRIQVQGLAHHLCQSRDGRIWFLAYSTLYSVTPGNLRVTSHQAIRGEKKSPTQIFLDGEDQMWCWERITGLVGYSIDNGDPVPTGVILHPVTGKPYEINWTIEDDLGRFWISQPTGVYVIDKQTGNLVKYLNAANSPLQQDFVWEMIKDQNGNIWLKQNATGSICLDQQSFRVVSFNPSWLFDPRRKEYSCVAAKGRDGKLFLDGTGTFGVFNPDSVRKNPVAPQVAMEETLVNGQEYRQSMLKLNHTQNNIQFRFCGLHFDDPDKNRYQYYLEGYNRDWVDLGFYRQAGFPGLRPGNYDFYVKACNSGGTWSQPVLLSTFRILPPWWGNMYAYAVYGMLVVSIIATIYRLQLRRRMAISEVKKLNEIDEFKNRFYTNISHEFRSPLAVISGLAENLEGKQGTLIRRNTDQILTLVDQILELSKIEADAVEVKREDVDIIPFTRYILYSFGSLIDEKALETRFSSGHESLLAAIDREKYTTILNNLLSNAIKFTPSQGRISVEIQRSGDRFELK